MNKCFIPTGLPGGFFIYEEGGEERLLFADENVINIFECETFEEFLEYTGGSFKGMVFEEDLHKIENGSLPRRCLVRKDMITFAIE